MWLLKCLSCALGSPPLRCYKAPGTRTYRGRRMGDKPVITLLDRPGRYRRVAIVTAISFAMGCSMLAAPASAQSLTDRFKGLFGGKPDEPAATTATPAM